MASPRPTARIDSAPGLPTLLAQRPGKQRADHIRNGRAVELFGITFRPETGQKIEWMVAPASISLPDGLSLGSGMITAVDADDRWVILFDTPWAQRYFEQRNPDVKLLELPESGL